MSVAGPVAPRGRRRAAHGRVGEREVDDRPHQGGGRRGGTAQGGPVALSSRAAPHAARRPAQPQGRSAGRPALRQHRSPAVGPRPKSPPCGRLGPGLRRNQLPRGAGGIRSVARYYGRFGPRTASARGVVPLLRRDRRSVGRAGGQAGRRVEACRVGRRPRSPGGPRLYASPQANRPDQERAGRGGRRERGATAGATGRAGRRDPPAVGHEVAAGYLLAAGAAGRRSAAGDALPRSRFAASRHVAGPGRRICRSGRRDRRVRQGPCGRCGAEPLHLPAAFARRRRTEGRGRIAQGHRRGPAGAGRLLAGHDAIARRLRREGPDVRRPQLRRASRPVRGGQLRPVHPASSVPRPRPRHGQRRLRRSRKNARRLRPIRGNPTHPRHP
jgi:hypothetical protein